METSDSECFESADEDFVSDEEDTSIVANKNVPALEKGVKNVSLASDEASKGNKTAGVGEGVGKEGGKDSSKSDEISRLISKYTSDDNKFTEAAAKAEERKTEGEKAVGGKTEEGKTEEGKTEDGKAKVGKIKDGKNGADKTAGEDNVGADKNKNPVEEYARTEDLKKEDNLQKANEINKNKEKDLTDASTEEKKLGDAEDLWGEDDWGNQITDSVLSKGVGRGYAIPPERVECWEPGMNYDIDRGYAIPPEREECWEPGMDYDEELCQKDDGETEVEKSKDDAESKPKQSSQSKGNSKLHIESKSLPESKLQSKSKSQPESKPQQESKVQPESKVQESKSQESKVQETKSQESKSQESKVQPESKLQPESKPQESKPQAMGRGYAIPPRRQTCWIPGVSDVKKVEPKKEPAQRRQECWEPGMNYDMEVEDKDHKMKDNKMEDNKMKDNKLKDDFSKGKPKEAAPKQPRKEKFSKENRLKEKLTEEPLKEKSLKEEPLKDFHKEKSLKEATLKEAPLKDLHKEEHLKDLHKEEHLKELHKEEPLKEELHKEEPLTEELHKEDLHKEDIKEEENLWDDDEDWGEPITTKITPPTVKEPPKFKSSSNTEASAPEEENLWDDDDDWEPITDTKNSNPNNSDTKTSHPKTSHPKTSQPKTPSDALDNLTNQKEESSGWGSWGSWGLSSVLSTATAGVSTLTSHVQQGLNTVLESGISIPDPEELARQHKEEKKREQSVERTPGDGHEEHSPPNSGLGLGLTNFVSGVSQITKLVEKTSTKVISGGLDTLETIGKKTMEVLQENDPGLKKKRAFLYIEGDKPILSQILREAKEKAEQENTVSEKKHVVKKPNYEALFDDHQGLVHLEALEMLSKQCDIKLQGLLESLRGNELKDLQETMDQVKELCELPDEEEEETLDVSEVKQKLESIVEEINIPIKYLGLIETWQEVEDWLSNVDMDSCTESEMHKQAIESLAHLTAIAVEQYHKGGELLLVKDHRSTADEADSLVQLTITLTALIGNVAGKFSEKLSGISKVSDNKEAINELITNVFFEAANSSSYIQDAFLLLIPVLQVGAV